MGTREERIIYISGLSDSPNPIVPPRLPTPRLPTRVVVTNCTRFPLTGVRGMLIAFNRYNSAPITPAIGHSISLQPLFLHQATQNPRGAPSANFVAYSLQRVLTETYTSVRHYGRFPLSRGSAEVAPAAGMDADWAGSCTASQHALPCVSQDHVPERVLSVVNAGARWVVVEISGSR